MPTSQNGWAVNPRRVPLVVNKVPFVGQVCAGDVAKVLGYVARQVAERVEPPKAGQCWGWAERPIRGNSTGYSNHASATAIDYNSLEHPRGSRGTFDKGQVKIINEILADVDGAVRWGGNYTSGPVDEMHFEINTNARHLAEVAAKIDDEEDDMFTDEDRKLIKALHSGMFVGSSTAGTKAGLIRIEVETQRRVTAGNALLELVAKGQKNLTVDQVQQAVEAALEAHEEKHPTEGDDEGASDEGATSATTA